MMRRAGLMGVLILPLVLLYLMVFQVQEGRQALIVRLGSLVHRGGQVAVYQPGLHVKRPLVDHVLLFDTRLQTLEETASRTLTKEQKFLMVDYFVKWRISQLPLYYRRTEGRSAFAQQIIRQKINHALRAAFGTRTVKEVVSDDRKNIMRLLRQEATASTQDLGVDVVDVRIKRIDLPSKVSHSVFLNMQADRERVAMRHRADGRAQAEAIRAQADAQAAVAVAEAQSQAGAIKARGDAQAAEVYTKAYSKAPGFYRLVSSLDVLRQGFKDQHDVMVLSPEAAWLRAIHQHFDLRKRP